MNLPNPDSPNQPFLHDPKLPGAARGLRVAWFIMVLSMGYMTFVFSKLPVTGTFDYRIMEAVAAFVVILSFVFPALIGRIMARTQAKSFEAKFGQILIQYILRFALTESGLILLLISSQSRDAGILVTYFGAFLVVMIIHYPKDENINEILK